MEVFLKDLYWTFVRISGLVSRDEPGGIRTSAQAFYFSGILEKESGRNLQKNPISNPLKSHSREETLEESWEESLDLGKNSLKLRVPAENSAGISGEILVEFAEYSKYPESTSKESLERIPGTIAKKYPDRIAKRIL